MLAKEDSGFGFFGLFFFPFVFLEGVGAGEAADAKEDFEPPRYFIYSGEAGAF